MTLKKYQNLTYVDEYRNTLREFADGTVDWERVADTLVNDHDWTETGAAHLVYLARNYGAFMLCHAAALAQVLDQEDGQLGF